MVTIDLIFVHSLSFPPYQGVLSTMHPKDTPFSLHTKMKTAWLKLITK